MIYFVSNHHYVALVSFFSVILTGNIPVGWHSATRSANAARIKDPLAGLRVATANQRIERTTATASLLSFASAAHPRGVGHINKKEKLNEEHLSATADYVCFYVEWVRWNHAH